LLQREEKVKHERRRPGVVGELCFWTRKEMTTQVGTVMEEIQLKVRTVINQISGTSPNF